MLFHNSTDERIGQLAETAIVLVGAITILINVTIATIVEKDSKPGSEAARLARDYLKSLLHK